MRATTILRAYMEAHTQWGEAQQVATRGIVESVMKGGGNDAGRFIRLMDRRNRLLDRCESRLLKICEEYDEAREAARSIGVTPRALRVTQPRRGA